MKLLTEVAEIEEYFRLRSLLESNGIVLHVGNEDTARNFGVFHPVGRYIIYIIFEEQFEDARALIVDSAHQVQTPMDVEQFRQLRENNQQKVSSTLLTFLSAVLLFVVFALSLFAIFIQ